MGKDDDFGVGGNVAIGDCIDDNHDYVFSCKKKNNGSNANGEMVDVFVCRRCGKADFRDQKTKEDV